MKNFLVAVIVLIPLWAASAAAPSKPRLPPKVEGITNIVWKTEIVTPRLLNAVAWVESSNDPLRVSPKGARGRYQLMEDTWKEHCVLPYDTAFEPDVAREVAVRYLIWIERFIISDTGRAATRDEVLAAWNGGIGRLARNKYRIEKMPDETRTFVRRVNAKMGGK